MTTQFSLDITTAKNGLYEVEITKYDDEGEEIDKSVTSAFYGTVEGTYGSLEDADEELRNQRRMLTRDGLIEVGTDY